MGSERVGVKETPSCSRWHVLVADGMYCNSLLYSLQTSAQAQASRLSRVPKSLALDLTMINL